MGSVKAPLFNKTNMFNFKEKFILTKENLFKFTDSYTVFRHYIGEFKIGRALSSPFRKDINPSFTININRVTNEFFFDDKVLGGGDCITFIQKLYGLTFNNALVKIARDLGISSNFKLSDEQLKGASTQIVKYNVDLEKLKKESETEIKVKSREWNLADKAFWTSFGITKQTLLDYNVSPISHIFFKDSIIKADKLAYVFREFKDFKETLTIYQPYNKDKKWFKTHDSSVWYGWDQMPDTGKKLIITKSMKDVMSIRDVTGYVSTGLQSEKVLPKLGVILELRGRFKDIYILYDNDFDKEQNWGRIAAKKLEKEFHFNFLEIPDDYRCKDFSDLVKKFGPDKAKEILDELINNVIYF